MRCEVARRLGARFISDARVFRDSKRSEINKHTELVFGPYQSHLLEMKLIGTADRGDLACKHAVVLRRAAVGPIIVRRTSSNGSGNFENLLREFGNSNRIFIDSASLKLRTETSGLGFPYNPVPITFNFSDREGFPSRHAILESWPHRFDRLACGSSGCQSSHGLLWNQIRSCRFL